MTYRCIYFLLPLILLLVSSRPSLAQRGDMRYRLVDNGRELALAQALALLGDAGAPLSFRPDQIPPDTVFVPGGRRKTAAWLRLLLAETELTFEQGAAGYLILPNDALSERTFNLYGVVTDARSGERLIGATLVAPERGRGTYTNDFGVYTLPLTGGRRRVRISYIGYRPREIEVVLRSDSLLNISLARNPALPSVIVTANEADDDAVRFFETGTQIGRAEVSQLGGIGGESDPLQLARLLPGITSGADGLGGVIIRGSEAGHNLILLDGVPIYNLSHAGGLFSIFSNQAIRRMDLYKEAIPARFGGRIGGVLDVHTRDGNLYENELTVGTSLLAARVAAEGPIEKGNSSFLLTGRYFWASDLLRRYSERYKEDRGRRGSTDYDVYDLNFKLNQRMSKRGRLYVSLYSGVDDYDNFSIQSDTLTYLNNAGAVFTYATPSVRSERVRWGNSVAALRYSHLFGERLFANFRLSYSRLATQSSFERSDSTKEINNDIVEGDAFSGSYTTDLQQLGLSFDGQYTPGPDTKVRFGTQVDFHEFRLRLLNETQPLDSLTAVNAFALQRPLHVSPYASYERRFGEKLHLRVGLRGSLWRNQEKNFYNLSPRILLAGPLSRTVDWQLSYDRTVQPVHLLNSFIIGLPSDFWVPASEDIAPATAPQYAGKLTFRPAPQWRFQTGLYYRRLNRLLTYAEGRSTAAEWIQNLSVGEGTAYGWESTLQRRAGRLRGWLSYTLARSERTFDRQVNLGMTFPFRYDRRHSLNLLLIYQLSERTTLTGSWRYESGLAYSLSLETIPGGTLGGGEDIPIFENRNGFRLPPNHRFDLNLHSVISRPDSRLTHSFDIGLYNAYNRRNTAYYETRPAYFLDADGTPDERTELYRIFIAPLLPSLSYQITFGEGPVFGR